MIFLKPIFLPGLAEKTANCQKQARGDRFCLDLHYYKPWIRNKRRQMDIKAEIGVG
jgi:hypothetical protein